MTTPEFDNEFDLLYSNNANVGPGLDTYEKSLFLTMAKNEIVKNYYSPKSNRKREGFEATEKRRKDLNELVDRDIAKNPFQTINNIDPVNGFFFEINSDVMWIIGERLKVLSDNDCINNTFIDVNPVTHDEYNTNKKNPYKAPDKENSWRLDVSTENDKKVVEIVGNSVYMPFEYYYSYIKKPSPIILGDISPDTIDGISVTTECELESIDREILNRAVEIALEVSGNPRLKSKMEVDLRNE